jgi:hypothetical protein
MGCYAATLTFAQRGKPAAMIDDAKKTLTVHDVVVPATSAGVLALGFDKAPYKGRVRATLDGKTVTASRASGTSASRRRARPRAPR